MTLGWYPLSAGNPTVVDLELVQAWSVEGPGDFQPSALALRGDELLTVGDKHSDTVFRIVLDGDVARCVPAVTFAGPEPLPRNGWLDLEAVAVDTDGSLLLASEEAPGILRVPAEGGEAVWVATGLEAAGTPFGIMTGHNMYCEGVVVLGPDHLLIAAERETRGLIEWNGSGGKSRLFAQSMDESRFPVPENRGLDFSELASWKGRILALARNQHLIIELVRGSNGLWREARTGWSFAAAENAPEHRYVDMSWGQAEGLALTADLIYVILDNGRLAREGAPEDSRPWLFAFRNSVANAP